MHRHGQVPLAWPTLAADVIVHGHCHQTALFGMQGDSALLNKLGVKWKLLDTGCCGMAGSFGFNAEHYALSQKIGEDKLFPAVREAIAANAETIVLTNGFSCREQIAQETDRHALHLAEVLQMALREATETPEGFPLFDAAPQHYPEDAWVRPHEAAIQKSMKKTGLALAGVAAGTALLLALARKR